MQTSIRNIRNGTRATARNGAFLSIEEMRNVAPAIFAESAHESRSQRYGFVPTAHLLDGLMAEGFQPVSVQQASSRTEGKETAGKHLIRFRHAGTHQVGDVFPEVVLLNSHDGSSSYQLMTGLFRLVCLNGLIACEGETDSIKVPHKANALHSVIEGSYSIIEKAPAVIESVKEMQSVNLTEGERAAFGRAALALRYENPEEAPIGEHRLDNARRREDAGPDLWRTLNRTQENLIRGGLRGYRLDENGRQRTTTTREIKGIDQTVSLNRGLWVLAEEMRKLKAA
ncbi:DUF945 domain-containing protein [Gammaproteobacteria bacterium]